VGLQSADDIDLGFHGAIGLSLEIGKDRFKGERHLLIHG
jgi:hypothetical protein